MTAILIAYRLSVKSEAKSTTVPKFMGAEFSPPISMDGFAVVAVTGHVRMVVRTNERCDAEVQGSNDLMRWHTVNSTALPDAVAPFAIPAVAVDHAWTRVRWVIRSTTEILADAAWEITAELNRGLG